MKKFKAILLSTISALGLASCSFQDALTAVKEAPSKAIDGVKDLFNKDKENDEEEGKKEEEEPKPCSHVDANLDHKCDLCQEAMGEHKDSDGDGKCDYCSANIPSVVSVTIEDGARSVGVGRSIKLNATVNAVGGASRSISWKVDNTSVASISSSGELTGLAPGSVTATATSSIDATKSASVTIEVYETKWSDASEAMMSEALNGVVLPYLGPTWSETSLSEGMILTTSPEGDLDELMSIFEEEGYYVEEMPEEQADGFMAMIQVGLTGYVGVQVLQMDEGFRLVAFYDEMSMPWPEEELAAFIGEHTEETVPTAEGTVYEVFKNEQYQVLCINVAGDYAAYMKKLIGLGWSYSLVGNTYFDCTSPEGYLNVIVFPDEGMYQIQVYLAEPPAAEWPAEAVAQMLAGHTEVEIPVAEGTGFEAQVGGDFYYGYVKVTGGSAEGYLIQLDSEGFDVFYDEQYECYTATKDNLALDIFVLSESTFYIQPYEYVAPAAEWPADEVAAFCEGYTEVEIPAAEGEEFYVQALNPAQSYGYFGVIQVLGGTCSEYLTTLQGAGFTVQYDETNNFYFAIKDNLELDIFDKTGYFAIQAAVYVDPTIWPAETIAAFLEGHTDVEVPAATGDSYIAQAITGYYYGQAIVYGGVVADYCTTLESAGFTVAYDEQNECYTAFKSDLAIDIYEYPTYMGLGFYTYVAPVAEWPAETIAELLEGKTEVAIPEAEGTSFTVAPLTGFYFGSITISGDMNTYLSVLEGAGFSVTWDTEYECYVAAKGNLLMDIGENPDDTGEFQMLLYLAPSFPTEGVAAAVQALVPGSETVVPEFEADEYQLADARAYIGGFVLYASGDSSLLNEYTGILDEAGWAVSELEEGVYGAVSPAEDIMLQVSYDDYYGELDVYILTYTKPATEWPANEVAALVESIEADGTVPAVDGLSFTCYEAEGWYPAQINVGVEEGTAEAAAAAYIADLEDAGFFLVMSSYGYDYYAEEGNTLALCVYAYGDDTFIIELGCLAEPAVKPLEGWPTDDVAALVASLDVEGSAVPEFEGEGISFSTQEASTYYGPLVKINAGANDPDELIEDYCAKLEGLGYFVAGDNYGVPVYALEGETLGISTYEDYNYGLVVELIKLSEPAVKPVPAAFPTEAVEAFFDGKTDEVVPEMVAYGFKTYDETSYLEIQAEGGNVKDYMKVLSDAGWTADYDSSAYYNYATSPEGSIKMTLINYTSYVTLKLAYVPPKLTEFPADAIAEALGEKAKTTLPGITGEGLQFEFTDNGDNSMKLDVYGSTPTEYVSTLENAGFTVTEGSEGDQYWYLLSADKTVKVQVYDYMSAGQDYFRVKAYGQDPTWTSDSFDAESVAAILGVSSDKIPNIADGGKFSFADKGNNVCEVTVDSGAKPDNFRAALVEAGFVQDEGNPNLYTNDNIQVVITILNPITQKYSATFSIKSEEPVESDWPIEALETLLGKELAATIPEADGTCELASTGQHVVTISVSEGDMSAYIEALTGAGFTYEDMMSAYCNGDWSIMITLTDTGSGNFNIRVEG